MAWGLRSKVMGVLALGFVLVGGAASLLLDAMQGERARELTRSAVERFVLLHRERVLSQVRGDLVLAQQMAGSASLQRWVLQPDPANTAAAVRELLGSSRLMSSQAVFIASRPNSSFYFLDTAMLADALDDPEPALRPSQVLVEDKADDGWFFRALRMDVPYEFSVDHNAELDDTKLWINVLMKHSGESVGVLGTGIELAQFLNAFLNTNEPGVSTLFIDEEGAIQAHRDRRRIALNSSETGQPAAATIWADLAGQAEVAALRAALAELSAGRRSSATLDLHLEGRPQIAAVAYLPEMRWFAIAAHDASHLGGATHWAPILGVQLGALALLAMLVAMLGERFVLAPLRDLERATHRVADGDYDVRLSDRRQDEIGEVARSFNRMAARLLEAERMVRTNVVAISAQLQRAETDAELTRLLFSSLAPLLDLGQASLYRVSAASGGLRLCGSYARSDGAAPATEIALGEGLVGQCAHERQAIELIDPPADYLRVGSGLGATAARVIALRPVSNGDSLVGVLELAALQPFSAPALALLDELLPVLAMCMEIVERSQRMQRLLEDAQQQAQRLATQSEQLEEQRSILAGQRESLQQVLDCSPVSIAITVGGIFRYLNPEFTRLFDRRVGDASLGMYLVPAERDAMIAELRQNGSVRGRAMTLFAANAARRRFQVTLINFDYGGEPGIMGWLVALDETGAPVLPS